MYIGFFFQNARAVLVLVPKFKTLNDFNFSLDVTIFIVNSASDQERFSFFCLNFEMS